MPQTEEVLKWRGQNVHDSSGEKIGSIEEIYLDEQTEMPEWLAVKAGGMFGGGKLGFIPLAEAKDTGGSIQVPYSKAQVKDAPSVDADGALSQKEEAALYKHYGLEYGENQSDSGLATGQREERTERPREDRGTVGNDVSGPETDDAMTRSEEELRVGVASRETGRARLRKSIVTENVTQTVPVKREEVRIEREPITDANRAAAGTGADLSEEEHEVTLTAEEAVVQKNVVPKERVRMDKDTVTEQQQVSEELRKEQIDVLDGAGEPAEGIDGQRGTDEGIRR